MNIWMHSIWIKLDIVLLFNLLTGCAAYMLWRLSERALAGYRSVKYLYYGLKAVIWSFFIPVMYAAVYVNSYDVGDGSWEGYFMVGTPLIQKISAAFGMFWSVSVLISAARYGWILYKEYSEKRGYVSEMVEETRVAEQLGRSMNMKKRIRVYYVEGITPCIGGLFHTRIYLGRKDYDEERLRMVIRHELIHYKHGDLRMRRMMLILRICYWFCPLSVTGQIHEAYRKYSEDYDDEAVCRVENKDRYIRTLLETAVWSAEKMYLLQPTAAESECDVLRRIEKMKGFKDKKRIGYSMAAAWTVVCLLMGSTTVYAAGAGVIKGYDIVYDITNVETEEVLEKKEYIEYTETGYNPDIKVEEGEVYDTGRSSTVTIDWNLGKNTAKETPAFQKSSGGHITVNIEVEPQDLTVKVGIVEPDGSRRSVSGSGIIDHTFNLDQSGEYKVFIENNNNDKVHIEGSYRK